MLYSRPGCGLCEDMLIALRVLPAAQGIGIDVVDVDATAQTRVRYGHKIPVLTVLVLLRKAANSPKLTGSYKTFLPDGRRTIR